MICGLSYLFKDKFSSTRFSISLFTNCLCSFSPLFDRKRMSSNILGFMGLSIAFQVQWLVHLAEITRYNSIRPQSIASESIEKAFFSLVL